MLQSLPELQSLARWGLADLARWAAARQLRFGCERSVKFCQSGFETRRVILSFAIGDLGIDALAEVLAIARMLKAPERHLQSISRFFFGAAYVHFGLEYGGSIVIGKCYLELPPPMTTARSSGRLQFLGFKWSINAASIAVVTRYRMLRFAGWQDVTALMEVQSGPALRPVMQSLMSVVCVRDLARCQAPVVLEVEEEGSDRKSLDLNVYDLQFVMSDLADSIDAAAGILNLDRNAVEEWLVVNAKSPIGHLAAGLGRDQQSFFTIYHGLSSVSSGTESPWAFE
jgi:hypothetical protein